MLFEGFDVQIVYLRIFQIYFINILLKNTIFQIFKIIIEINK